VGVSAVIKAGSKVVTPEGRRATVKYQWRERRFHRPPRYRVVVEFRDHNTKSYWLDELKEASVD
jgi:hypothetical protein